MNQSRSRARDGAPSGFRIIVPEYCRPGQVICVQARVGHDGVRSSFKMSHAGRAQMDSKWR